MLAPNKYYSYNIGELPRGCQYCVRGEKLVVFATGLCPRKCYFCPISDQKYNQDVTYANERKIEQDSDLLLEADFMQAKGAGITGGDPLMELKRTTDYIIKLKQKYGSNFHIHLYTSLNLVTETALQQLYQAGLDEIRFHLDLESTKLWPKLELARKFSWKVGVELPLLPTKKQELIQLLEFIKDKVDFLNLNELEIADNSMSKLGEMGFKTKDTTSYAIADSMETGLQIIDYVQSHHYSLPVHVCTAKLKDAVQLANRLKRESQRVRRPFDIVSKEGMLTRGALYHPELVPGFGYRKKLETVDKDDYIQQLLPLLEKIKKRLKLNDEEICLDAAKPRIIFSSKLIKNNRSFFKKLNLIPAIVSEYPTADQLEIEVELF
ncbi:MAG: radical SAM protein [Nanoarchaeota archaeon]